MRGPLRESRVVHALPPVIQIGNRRAPRVVDAGGCGRAPLAPLDEDIALSQVAAALARRAVDPDVAA